MVQPFKPFESDAVRSKKRYFLINSMLLQALQKKKKARPMALAEFAETVICAQALLILAFYSFIVYSILYLH